MWSQNVPPFEFHQVYKEDLIFPCHSPNLFRKRLFTEKVFQKSHLFCWCVVDLSLWSKIPMIPLLCILLVIINWIKGLIGDFVTFYSLQKISHHILSVSFWIIWTGDFNFLVQAKQTFWKINSVSIQKLYTHKEINSGDNNLKLCNNQLF